MALKELHLEGFRGKTTIHKFNQKNRIVGRNGAGKSTIKEAICFAFLGTDSEGNRNPQHLITAGEPATKVTVITDKAEICRSLTAKGNGTLKLIRDGVNHTLTQTQLETMLGSQDLFLSVFIPGYFLRLSAERQHKVISEVQPKIDREVLFSEICGFSLNSEEKLRYNLNRRPDLVAAAVATDRREYEKEVARLEGDIRTLAAFKPVEQPTVPAEIDIAQRLTALSEAWKRYRGLLNTYSQAKLTQERTRLENEQRQVRLKEIEGELSKIKLLEVPKLVNRTTEIEALQVQLKPTPSKPSFMKEVDSDNCSTCGQTVGLKHREKVKEQNTKLTADYQKSLTEVEEFNNEVKKKISEISSATTEQAQAASKVVEKNRGFEAQRQKFLLEQASLALKDLPDIGAEPQPPTEPFGDTEAEMLKRAHEVVADYHEKVAQHNYVQKQIEASGQKIQERETQIAKYKELVFRLEKIENTLKVLPQEEMRRQVGVFDIPGLTVEVEKDIGVFVYETPYALLSTGQRMKVDRLLSQRFNSLMPKPINMIFVDDANLIDETSLTGDLQVFAAEIDPTIEEVTIHAE